MQGAGHFFVSSQRRQRHRILVLRAVLAPNCEIGTYSSRYACLLSIKALLRLWNCEIGTYRCSSRYACLLSVKALLRLSSVIFIVCHRLWASLASFSQGTRALDDVSLLLCSFSQNCA